MTIPVTCPRCRAAARVPDTLVGRTVRCPPCLTPSPAPPAVPPAAADDAPPGVTAAVNPGPPDVPVVKIPRPTTAPSPARGATLPAVISVRRRRKDNAGVFVGVAVGAAVFLILGGVGAPL